MQALPRHPDRPRDAPGPEALQLGDDPPRDGTRAVVLRVGDGRQGLRLPSRRQADRFALTDAEQRVADLVSEGLTNRAVADRLAYSVKTIEAYLSRIYAKTGCSNRVALARHLAAAAEPGER